MVWITSSISFSPGRLCVVALAALVSFSTTSVVCAQRGPVLPTRQDFPDPSNAKKPVTSGDSLGPASDSLESDSAFEIPKQERPSEPSDVEVFEPPVPPSEEPRTNRKLDFGTPAPRLPPVRRPVRTGAATTRYNVGVALTEVLLNRLAADVRQEAESVCDRILGTPVSGIQTTNATTRIDCRPNQNIAQVDVVLESLTSSNTLGRRPAATISTEGFHRADLIKPVFFDGQVLRTRRPQGFIKANNLTRGVVTSLTGIPLVGPIANRYAQSQAAMSRTAGETETAALLSRRVVPQFNQTVDNKLSDANVMLRNQVQSWLRERQLWPSEMEASTTDDELRLRARYGEPLGSPGPGRRLFGRYGSVLLHETAINAYLTQLNMGGLRVSDRQLRSMLSGIMQNQTAPVETVGEGGVDDDSPELYTIVFAPTDPVRVRFDEGQSEVVLRLSIEPIVGGAIPMQELHLPVLASVVGDAMELSFGKPGVAPADGTEPNMVSRLIGEQIAELTKTVSMPNQREFTFGPQRTMTAKISDIAAANGWLLIAID